ncbi:MAG: N-formylglutamate deformylase [Polyangiaceae bacterium]
MSEVFELTLGTRPLLLSCPHDGTMLPAELAQRMTAEGRAVPDTDFHVARLYDFARALGATVLVARLSRFVIDLNRDPEGHVLYPGADNTGLCPTTTFDRGEVYLPGQSPSDDEVRARQERYFAPYHQCLQEQLERLRARFPRVVLFDAHSIRSRVPRFFDGELPDLNLGTAGGQSAEAALADRVHATLEANEGGYSVVRDGRFKGGYITRHYGRPEAGVSALQLELAQKNYMNEAPPFDFVEERARRLRPTLQRALQACLAFAEGRES